MKTGDYEIIRYEPRYLDDVVELLVPLWGPDLELNKAYFKWKHVDNPYALKPVIHLALHGSRPIGIRAYFGTYWETGDPAKRYFCLSDADAVVHPDHRRSGLLKQMTLYALDELTTDAYDYIITLSGSPFSSAANLKMGWKTSGELKTMAWKKPQETSSGSTASFAPRDESILIRAYRKFRMLSGLPMGLPAERTCFGTLDRNLSRLKQFGKSSIVAEKVPRVEAMAAMVASGHRNGRLKHVRDEQFFSWRYRNPMSSYRFLFMADGGMTGYLVLHSQAHIDANYATIVDWEASHPDVLSGLLQAAIQYGGFQKLETWSGTLSMEERLLFRSLSFSDVKNGPDSFIPTILVKPVREAHIAEPWLIDGRELRDSSNWELRAIYSDSF